MRRWWRLILVLTIFGVLGKMARAFGPDPTTRAPRDVHSYSRTDEIRVKHLHLDLTVDFPRKVLRGTATWTVERQNGCPPNAPLILDTHDLRIELVEAGQNSELLRQTNFTLGDPDPVLGSALSIDLPTNAHVVRVTYETSPGASALQWVEPSGTSGKLHPFLFSQSQAIHARSYVPCQDSPGIRITYDATLHVPRELKAVMAAEGPFPLELKETSNRDSMVHFGFRMPQPIPSYLIALAVGDLEFRKIGPRTGVWAEPSVVEKAAWEFADTEKMVEAAERLFGPYRWGRYDLLVLPPSFPFGGMENPRLTFATPTVLAGDRSQVALVAHELAHSWSGNLVTNATWSDFWLNEGFTVYLERRILEDLYGSTRAEMEAVLGYQELREELDTLKPRDQVLHLDLSGRDPDDGVTRVPYEKGALFLKALEEKTGRDRLTTFLRNYFDHFAFQSITTGEFERFLRERLFDGGKPSVDLHAWFEDAGLPPDAPVPQSDRFAAIESQAKAWLSGEAPTHDLDTKDWSTLEWLHFLRSLPTIMTTERMAQLDAVCHLTNSGNAEIAMQWLLMAIRAEYHPADARLEQFLTTIGRRKFLMPLYNELIKTPSGKVRARRLFEKARTAYHPIAVDSVQRLLTKP